MTDSKRHYSISQVVLVSVTDGTGFATSDGLCMITGSKMYFLSGLGVYTHARIVYQCHPLTLYDNTIFTTI